MFTLSPGERNGCSKLGFAVNRGKEGGRGGGELGFYCLMSSQTVMLKNS